MRSLFSSRSKRADHQAFDDVSADPNERLLADVPTDALEETIAATTAPAAGDNSGTGQSQDVEIAVTLSRGDATSQQGLGLVFDSNFAVSKLLPGCAAEANGQIQVGDILLAVDNVELQAGDSVRALFPVSEATFNLRLLRPNSATLASMLSMTPSSDSASRGGAADALTRSLSRMAVQRELAGKFDASRPGPVFQEVLWNEYCVLFPDGSSSPFDDKVRYTALTGYLRKKPVARAGRAEFAISHGESQRNWVRHFFHLSMKQLAWFDQDPNKVLERKRIASADASVTAQVREASRSVKASASRGKGVGSALLYAAPCRLYVSRLYPNEFALSYGEGSLLLMQAATGGDAQQWLVSLASCLFFSSAAFEAVLAECAAFFEAAPKTLPDRLSPIEALDVLRGMGRPCTYTQVIAAAAEVSAHGGWFGVREFTHLVRSVCKDSDPRAELLRAFRVLDGPHALAAADPRTAAGAPLDDADASLSVAELRQTLEAAGVPNEHVLWIVLGAAGGDPTSDRISYARLADALYPAAATAAKRRRMVQGHDDAALDASREAEARNVWERERTRMLVAAQAAAPAPNVLVSLRRQGAGGGGVDSGAGVGLTNDAGNYGEGGGAHADADGYGGGGYDNLGETAMGAPEAWPGLEEATERWRAEGEDPEEAEGGVPGDPAEHEGRFVASAAAAAAAPAPLALTPRASAIMQSIQSSAATGSLATPRTIQTRVNERLNRATAANRRRPQPTAEDAARLPTRGAAGKALQAMLAPKAPLPPGVPPNTGMLHRT